MQKPQDIKPGFLKIARRLQASARQNSGVAVLELNIVLDENGNPIWWTSPKITLLEPKSQKDEIIKLLTGGA